MKHQRYILWGLLDLAIVLPVVYTTIYVIGIGLAALTDAILFFLLAVGLCVLFGVWRGRRFAKRFSGQYAQEVFRVRYLPVLVGVGYTLLIAAVASALPIPEEGPIFAPVFDMMAFSHLPSVFLIAIAPMHWGYLNPWVMTGVPAFIYITYGLGMTLGFRQFRVSISQQWSFKDAGIVVVSVLVMLGVSARFASIGKDVIFVKGTYSGDAARRAEMLSRYKPWESGNHLVNLDASRLVIAEGHPVLDGATALFPVYAAAAQAIYQGADHRLVATSKTPRAYERLIAGGVDIIFVAQPSSQQVKVAEDARVVLELTPIAREAFVFFVNQDNPVKGLSSEQIRRIYKKEIRNWSEVGGADRKILPFQRPEGSGSQTTFEKHVMNGESPAAPLQAEIRRAMGSVIRGVAEYQNRDEAIGYSFRYYLTEMDKNESVRMLEIDGVAPTPENIRSGAYPYTVEFYAVTAGSENPNVPLLIDWFKSAKGQELIEKVGYVGLER